MVHKKLRKNFQTFYNATGQNSSTNLTLEKVFQEQIDFF